MKPTSFLLGRNFSILNIMSHDLCPVGTFLMRFSAEPIPTKSAPWFRTNSFTFFGKAFSSHLLSPWLTPLQLLIALNFKGYLYFSRHDPIKNHEGIEFGNDQCLWRLGSILGISRRMSADRMYDFKWKILL